MTKTKPDTANQIHVLDINPRARIVADNRQ